VSLIKSLAYPYQPKQSKLKGDKYVRNQTYLMIRK